MIEHIQYDTMYEPWLSYLWNDIPHNDFDKNLPNNETLRLGGVILQRKTGLKDVVDKLSYIIWIDFSILREGNVGLKLMEELVEWKRTAPCICGVGLGRSIAKILVVLRDYERYVAVYEGG